MTSAEISRKVLVTSYIVSAIPVLMLLLSAALKITKPAGIDEGMKHLGWDMSQLAGLAIVEIGCVVIYLIPRTAVLGAILITAFFGGTVATHARVGDPFYIQIGLGILIWLGLWLRTPLLRSITPFVKE